MVKHPTADWTPQEISRNLYPQRFLEAWVFTNYPSASPPSIPNERLDISKYLAHVLVTISQASVSPIMGHAFKAEDRCLLSFLMLQAWSQERMKERDLEIDFLMT